MAGLWKFFIGGGWKYLLIAAILGTALKFGYEYYRDQKARIATLIEQTQLIAELKAVNDTNMATIAAQQEQATRNELARQELVNSLSKADSRVDELENLLSAHNLEFLALNKPGLIERRINDATDNAFDSIECATGGVCVSSGR